MKKRIGFWLILVCVLAFMSLASAEEGAGNINLSFPMGEAIFDVKMTDDKTMIVLTNTSLYRVDKLSGVQEKLGTRLEGSIGISCDPQSGIYTTAKMDEGPFDTLYRFNGASADWEVFAQIPTEMGNEFYGRVIDGYFFGDTFYFLEYLDGQPSVLASFGLTDQQMATYGPFSVSEGSGSVFLMGNQMALLRLRL